MNAPATNKAVINRAYSQSHHIIARAAAADDAAN